MAGEVRKSSFSMKVDLLKKGHAFSFFQVMRLLRLLGRDAAAMGENEAHAEDMRGNIRIRPDLSLAFPASDVAKIEETTGDAPGFQVTTTFLGLYGSSSPLPTFYTEDLIEEAREDMSVSRDFIDIINHRLFWLLFRCWNKYRLYLKVVEEKSNTDMAKLFCLAGLDGIEVEEDSVEPYSLLRYVGLFTQFPRSALGLETLLKDSLGVRSLEVVPCVPRIAKIPEDQRFRLGISGNVLGVDSFLGEEILDRTGKFRLKIGPLGIEKFQSLLRGSRDHRRLAFLTGFYLTDRLEYDIELTLAEGEAGPIHLGAPKWSRLGLDTWIFTADKLGEVTVAFPPEYQ